LLPRSMVNVISWNVYGVMIALAWQKNDTVKQDYQ